MATLTGAPASTETRGAPGDPGAPITRLSGRRLLAVRVAWGALAGLLVGAYALFLPVCLAQLQTECSGTRCALVQPSPGSAETLRMLGFSVGGYAAVTFALILLSSLVSFAVAGVIVWHKSDDWMALLVALAEVAVGTVIVSYLVYTGHSPWQLLALVVNALDWALLFLLFALFPTGRFVPRWSRWVVVGWVVVSVALIVLLLVRGELSFTAYALARLAVLAGVGAAQVYRYRAVSGPRERAQTRWVVFGASAGIAVVVVIETPTVLLPVPGRPGSLYLLVSVPIYTLPAVLFSVCVGIAILRYRLYDIDVTTPHG